MFAFPNHMAIRLVAEDGNVPIANQIGQLAQVLGGGNTPGGIVRRIKKDCAGTRTRSQELLHIVQIRPELMILSKLTGDHTGATALDIRAVGREMRTENQHLIGGHPADAIRQAVAATAADIVVMGSMSRSGLQRLLIGNTADKLLYRLNCDLLLVKPTGVAKIVARERRAVTKVWTSP